MERGRLEPPTDTAAVHMYMWSRLAPRRAFATAAKKPVVLLTGACGQVGQEL